MKGCLEDKNTMANKYDIVKRFTHNNRKCVVMKCQLLGIGIYHNGYVECRDDLSGEVVADEEVTFYGVLDNDDCKYIGFDTAHWYNRVNPHTQSESYVEYKCKKIANSLNRKYIEERKANDKNIQM